MASAFTFSRVAGIALFAGVAVGAGGAGLTLAHSRLGNPGALAGTSYAELAGNPRAGTVADNAGPRFCDGCRDTYQISYVRDPGRPRIGVRVAERGAFAEDPFADGGDWLVDYADPDTGVMTATAADDPAVVAEFTEREQARRRILADASANMTAALAATALPEAGTADAAAPITVAAAF